MLTLMSIFVRRGQELRPKQNGGRFLVPADSHMLLTLASCLRVEVMSRPKDVDYLVLVYSFAPKKQAGSWAKSQKHNELWAKTARCGGRFQPTGTGSMGANPHFIRRLKRSASSGESASVVQRMSSVSARLGLSQAGMIQ